MSTNHSLLSAPMRRFGWQRWRTSWSTGWLSSAGAWVGLVLILLALGLLWAFYQVTRAVVLQSEQRLHSILVYNQATWHCNGLRDPIARQHCLSQRNLLAGDLSARLP